MSFKDKVGITDKRAVVLTYTDDQAENILESLRGQGNFLNGTENKPSSRQLEFLLKREVNCTRCHLGRVL